MLISQSGPTLVSSKLIPDVSKLHIRGLKNGDVMQDCPLTYVFAKLTHQVQKLIQSVI
jgi:hypothetical protein